MDNKAKNTILTIGAILAAGYIAKRFFGTQSDYLLKECGNIDKNLLTHQTNWYLSAADQLQSYFWAHDGFTEDEESIIYLLSQLETNEDFIYLACKYGKRGGSGIFALTKKSLLNSIADYLSESDKDKIRKMFSDKNISIAI